MIKDSFGQRHSSHGSIHRKLKELFRILLTLLHWVFSQMNIKTHPENIFKVISVCVSTTISLVQAYSSEFWTENPRCVIFFFAFYFPLFGNCSHNYFLHESNSVHAVHCLMIFIPKKRRTDSARKSERTAEKHSTISISAHLIACFNIVWMDTLWCTKVAEDGTHI